MKLLSLTTVALTTAFSGTAFAGDTAGDTKVCNKDNFMQVLGEVKDASAEAKDLAIAELQLAKEKMIAGDPDACAVHLTNASNAAVSG